MGQQRAEVLSARYCVIFVIVVALQQHGLRVKENISLSSLLLDQSFHDIKGDVWWPHALEFVLLTNLLLCRSVTET